MIIYCKPFSILIVLNKSHDKEMDPMPVYDFEIKYVMKPGSLHILFQNLHLASSLLR
jgi:hypothetical protein